MMRVPGESRRAGARARRGTTLVEAMAVVVVLSLAVPGATGLMIDAARARRDAANAVRAAWLAAGALEHVLADVSAGAGAPGFDSLASSNSYLNDSAAGLYARIAPLTDLAAAHGIACSVAIGPLTDHAGATTGNAATDVYRTVTVTATFPPSTGGAGAITVSARVTGL